MHLLDWEIQYHGFFYPFVNFPAISVGLGYADRTLIKQLYNMPDGILGWFLLQKAAVLPGMLNLLLN
jgi:hypothetical protein